MKIGVLTFHCAINYGAVLQAYGLKEVLRRMGHEVHVIDFRPEYLTWDRKCFRPGLRLLKTKKGIELWTNYILSLLLKPKKIEKFDTFIDRTLESDKASPFDVSSVYDAIICGSDQIWNQHITGGKLEDAYFGQYPTGKTKQVIAYAASVGDIRNLEGLEGDLTDKLRNFFAVSCREASLTDYVNNLRGTEDAITVLDPSLLAGKEIFDGISEKRLCEKPYLLYFDLFNDDSIRRRARTLAKEKGLKFVEVSTYHEFVPGQKVEATASPEDFCSWVRHADFVVTTSFHGTAFSVIFNREFLTFEFEEKKNDRILNLLALAGLDNNFVKRGEPLPSQQEIDWTDVNKRIGVERERSLDFLRKALEQ